MSMRGRKIRCQNATSSGTHTDQEIAEYDAWVDAIGPTNVTQLQWVAWKRLYGTTAYGNLPQHKKHHHVGYCWLPCPYSTQSSDLRTLHLLGTSSPSEGRNSHVGVDDKIYYMATEGGGARWGFECTFDGCPYETAYGVKYFYT